MQQNQKEFILSDLNIENSSLPLFVTRTDRVRIFDAKLEEIGSQGLPESFNFCIDHVQARSTPISEHEIVVGDDTGGVFVMNLTTGDSYRLGLHKDLPYCLRSSYEQFPNKMNGKVLVLVCGWDRCIGVRSVDDKKLISSFDMGGITHSACWTSRDLNNYVCGDWERKMGIGNLEKLKVDSFEVKIKCNNHGFYVVNKLEEKTIFCGLRGEYSMIYDWKNKVKVGMTPKVNDWIQSSIYLKETNEIFMSDDDKTIYSLDWRKMDKFLMKKDVGSVAKSLFKIERGFLGIRSGSMFVCFKECMKIFDSSLEKVLCQSKRSREASKNSFNLDLIKSDITFRNVILFSFQSNLQALEDLNERIEFIRDIDDDEKIGNCDLFKISILKSEIGIIEFSKVFLLV